MRDLFPPPTSSFYKSYAPCPIGPIFLLFGRYDFSPCPRKYSKFNTGLPLTIGITSFQSTRPRGARQSGHAPMEAPYLFQSTRPRGARPGTHATAVGKDKFQSTRPRGARPKPDAGTTGFVSFNPRARGGRDFTGTTYMPLPDVSIHAPAGGAT